MGKKILKALLTVLFVVAAALACWGLTLYNRWDAWVGFALFAAILALVFGFSYIRRVLYRTRQRLQDAAARRKGKPAASRSTAADVRTQWKEAIRTLKRSSLSKRGDPVYVLPWYMVIGREGAGKTTALTRARLTSPIKEVRQSMLVPPTTGIDWWYFDRSVVIDTTGRYVAAEGPGDARDEWTRVLGLLAKTRRKEPLNGVVVTVAADLLLFGSPDTLAEEGRLVRNRIDDLMRVLDTKFPIYLVVTKCDSLYGLDEWAGKLPPKTLDQPLGYCGGAEGTTTAEFLDQAFNSVLERLRDLRLALSQRFPTVPAGLLLLPNEFERLRPGLEKFFAGAFGENPYLETPLLRGMFFCSGLQRGGASSYVLKDSGLPEETTMLSGSANGLFLHDLFDKVIPADRDLHRPLGRFSRWERLTRSIGYSGWLLAGLALAIGLTMSFYHNVDSLQQVHSDYPAAGKLTGQTAADLETLRRQYRVIRQLQERNEHWETRLVWLGDDVVGLDAALRARFVADFRKSVLNRMDQQLALNLSRLADTRGEAGRTAFIQFVVRRLNLLQARLDAATLPALAAMPPSSPDGTAVLRLASMAGADDLSPATAKAFDELYVAYLAWSTDLAALGNERDALQKWLRQLALSSENLNWMVAWANEQAGLAPVRLSDFWPGEALPDPAPVVEAAFTARGLEAINAFFRELDAAAAEPRAMEARRKAFQAWYREQRFTAWRLFATNFDLGREMQNGEAQWRALVPAMATLRSPHFQLLERIAREFDGPAFDVDAPDWVRVSKQLVAIRPTGRKDGLLDAASRATGVLNTAGKQIIDTAISTGVPGGKAVFTNYIEAAKAYETLYAQFATIASEAIDGPGKAQKLSADFRLFSVDPAVKESALHTAYASLEKLKAMMGGVKPDNQPAWDLATGPLNFMLAFVEELSACMLQSAWDANVFFPTQGASSDADLAEQLYGAKGSVWTFANETAKPFLRRGATRYEPVVTRGTTLAFTPAFLAFVNDANAQRVAQAEAQRAAEADQKRQQLVQQRQQLERQRKQIDKQKREQALERRQQDVAKQLRGLEQAAAESKMAMDLLRAAVYPVTISALPTGVNPEAKARPFQTTLTVQCAPSPTVLNNFNFPLNLTLNWSAATCGDTTLQIRIEDITLERRFQGPQGFQRFVQEFFSGERVFSSTEFPAQQARLSALGVTAIGVRYTFAGQEAILRNAEQQAAFAQLDVQRQKERQRLEALRERIELEIQEERRNDLAAKAAENTEDRTDVGRRIEELSAPATMAEAAVPKKIVACWDPAAPRRSPFAGQAAAEAMKRPPAATPVPAAAAAAVSARERPAPVQAPAQAPVQSPPAQGQAAPEAGDVYWVQVGVFRQDVVEPLVRRLQQAGIEARVSTVTLRNGSVYQQVRNGPYRDIESARAMAARVEETARLKTLIMKRPLGSS